MAFTHFRSLLSACGRNHWPRYRSRRAGRLLRAKEITQRYNISQVQVRQVNHVKTQTDFRGHNPANCVFIATNQCRPKATEGQSKQFVPWLLLSNVIALSPEVDELSHVVQNANYDLVCITETWPQQYIPDSVVAINGYNVIRLDRRVSTHGGVCMYVKDTIPYSVLKDLEDESDVLEVLWVKLRPTRLPRGVSNIVIGVVYHPPNAVNSTMLDYLSKCLGDLESRYPNCGIFVLGDLSKLNDTRLKSNFNLKQIVQFSTRGQNTLDKVLTNLEDYYAPPIKRSALGLSDHSSVEVQPKQRVSTSR